MGFSLSELERNLTEETELFRLELFEVCCKAEAERGTFGISHYAFFREPLITRLSSKSVSTFGNFLNVFLLVVFISKKRIQMFFINNLNSSLI